MLLHRAETFLHIVSTTDLTSKKNNEKDDVDNLMVLFWASAQDEDDDGQTTSGEDSGKVQYEWNIDFMSITSCCISRE